MAGVRNEIEVATHTLGLQLQLVPAVSPDDFVDAFTAIASERAEALIVMPSPMLFGEYERIVSIAANNRLPAMGRPGNSWTLADSCPAERTSPIFCPADRHVCEQNPERGKSSRVGR